MGEVNLAGSNQISHIVDCVLVLESDSDSPVKFLRATKNRFGATSEVGLFMHDEKGLQEIKDPMMLLDSTGSGATVGAAKGFLTEGIRLIPFEVNSLTVVSSYSNPRNQVSGINSNRAQIIAAALIKYAGAKLSAKDLYVSSLSGLRVNDPTADLPIAAAILSSDGDKPIPSDTLFVGEITLTGSVRGTFNVEQKISEASRLGFTRIVLPKSSEKKQTPSGIEILTLKDLRSLPALLSRLSGSK